MHGSSVDSWHEEADTGVGKGQGRMFSATGAGRRSQEMHTIGREGDGSTHPGSADSTAGGGSGCDWRKMVWLSVFRLGFGLQMVWLRRLTHLPCSSQAQRRSPVAV